MRIKIHLNKIKKGGSMEPKKHLAGIFLIFCLGFFSSFTTGESHDEFKEELLNFFTYRVIGPARQCGRILHIAVPENQPYTFYVVPGSGGLWKTVNNGTTFESILPDQSNIPVGHVALAPSDPDIIWVGTGDAASGRTAFRGHGVFKSMDGGKTWKNMGLEKSHHIGRIAIHPKNPNIIYVVALGYHFSFNRERGLFKTTNGGESWEKVLFISEKVGFVDVAINPQKPEIIYAASYDKRRVPWDFQDFGPGSTIYRSTDGGKTWKKLGNGLPSGKIGRIGLAIYPKNPNIIYANITNNNARPPTEKEAKQDRKRGTKPQERRIGGEVYRSDDGGETWKKMNSIEESIGGGKWYSQIYIDPNNDKVIYVVSTNLYRSTDGGKTWGKEGPENLARGVHVDHHAIWIDPENSNHVILGNDGGLAITYDWGKTWDVYDNLPLTQYYAIGVDMDEPYNIYGGTQDNGSVRVPSNSIYGQITVQDWVSVGWGDGMYNQVDPNDSRWLYNDYQLGAIQRFDQKLGIGKNIKPSRKENDLPLRFHWTSPIHISPHNSQIIYLGAQVLFRSLNRGDNWQEISPDLTTNDPEKLKGNIEFCTITTISESPIRPGIIWVGTDDGKIQLTTNGGRTWTDLTQKIGAAGGPENYYVSRVFASNFKEGTAYVTKTGFQRDDYSPFIYKTKDFGESWTSIFSNLPEGIVYVIVEDRKNPNLLFIGTEMDVYVSIDGGKRWVRMRNNMPTNALVYDLLIHPRENDLVVATHGRGLFITDITPLQELNEKVLSEDIYFFEVEPKIQWIYKRRLNFFGQRQYVVPNEPYGLVINYYLKTKSKDKVKVTITDPNGEEIMSLDGKSNAGINSVVWNMRRPPTKEESEQRPRRGEPRGQLVSPGEYVITLAVGERKSTRKAQIRKMPQSQ